MLLAVIFDSNFQPLSAALRPSPIERGQQSANNKAYHAVAGRERLA